MPRKKRVKEAPISKVLSEPRKKLVRFKFRQAPLKTKLVFLKEKARVHAMHLTALGLVVAILLSLSSFESGSAASYTFVQDDWSGGASVLNGTHPGDQSGWNKYFSATNTDALSVPGSLFLSGYTGEFTETFTTTTYRSASTTATWTTGGSLSLTNASATDLIGNIYTDLAVRDINAVTLDAQTGMIYIGADSGKFLRYNPATGTSTSLTNKISAFLTANILALAADGNGLIYIGGASGKFAKYNISSDTATDLTSSISAFWSTNFVNALAYGGGNIYLVGNAGKFAKFDGANATDLTSSISAFWSTSAVNAVAYDGTNVYVGGASGKIAKYDGASATDLTSALAVHWTASILAMVYSPGESKLYMGGGSGKLASYDGASFTNLTSAISSVWGTSNISALSLNSTGSGIFLLGSDKLASYVEDVATNLTNSISSFWYSGTGKSMVINSSTNKLFVAGEEARIVGLQANYSFNEGSGQTAADLFAGWNLQLGTSTEVGSDDPQWTTDGGYTAPHPRATYLHFDGGDFAYATSVPFGGSVRLGVGMWIKFGANGSDMNIITDRSSSSMRWAISRDSSDKVTFSVRVENNTLVSAVSDASFGTDLGWHFIYGAYDGIEVKIYGDGVSLDSSTNSQSGLLPALFGPIVVGGDYSGGAVPNFVGDIDDIRIWWDTLPQLSANDGTLLGGRFASYADVSAAFGQSLTVDTVFENIRSVTITKNDTAASGTIAYYVSNDGGTTFYQATPNSPYIFSTPGSDLRFKIALTGNASVQDVTLAYAGYNGLGELMSSAYNSNDATNIISKIAWNATTTGSSTISFQIRSAADSGGSPGTWSPWCGDDDVSVCDGINFFESEDNDISFAINHPLRNGGNDQWFQYRVILYSNNMDTPELGSVTINYVVNAPPEINSGVTASQSTSTGADQGKVLIQYEARDPDTLTGSFTPGYVTPSFEYNIGGGWIAITTSTLSAGDVTDKSVSQINYSQYSASWNASSQISGVYYPNAQVRVTVNDNEFANNLAQATSITFILDTKVPSSSVVVDSVSNVLTISASDDSLLEYRISNNLDLSSDGQNASSGVWQSVGATSTTATSTWSLTGTYEKVYVEVRDAYGNLFLTSSTVPAIVSDLDIKDISNVQTGEHKEFISWNVYAATTSAAFSKYEVHRSTDGDSYLLHATISSSTTNYLVDTGLSSSTVYYYKVKVFDTDGDISDFSAVVSDQPNGQGGTDLTPPAISNVAVAEAKTSWARITWTTDELSSSRVDHSAAPSTAFASTTNGASFSTSHEVVVTGLQPNTSYLFQVRSDDVFSNVGTSNNGGAGHSLTTTGGPLISNVTAINVAENAATIFWNTNSDSDSYVVYSTNASMAGSSETGNAALVGASASSSLFQHKVELSGLSAASTYYYYVKSTDGSANTAIDTNGNNYFSFRTTADEKKPVLSAIGAPVRSSNSVVITWSTDEPATSQVQYGTEEGSYTKTSVLDNTLTLNHVVTLSDLVPERTYHYRVISKDNAGNESVSGDNTVTTTEDGVVVGVYSGSPPTDTAVPSVSEISVTDIGSFDATVNFTTNEPALGIVEYGSELPYSFSAAASKVEYGTKHALKLTGLRMGTPYHFRIRAVDKAGNSGYSSDRTFTTLFLTESLATADNASEFRDEIENAIESALPSLVPPFIEIPRITQITHDSAVVSWRTNIKAYGIVHYAPENEYDKLRSNPYSIEISDTSLKKSDHELRLVGLLPNTRYHLMVKSFSIPRSVGSGPDLTFTTQPLKINFQILEIRNRSFRVLWTTSEPADSTVEFKDLSTGAVLQSTQSDKNTYHDIRVMNLTPGTTYEVRVFGRNARGSLIESGKSQRVTLSKDLQAPEINTLKIESALIPGRNDRAQTVVGWKTNEPATSMVFFEAGGGDPERSLANKTEETMSFVEDHKVILPNLKPGSIYRIQVGSTDEGGNLTLYPVRTIVIPRQTESVVDVIFKNFEQTFQFLRNF
jgi:hypothetical protein